MEAQRTSLRTALVPPCVTPGLPCSETCSGSFWKTPRAQKARPSPAPGCLPPPPAWAASLQSLRRLRLPGARVERPTPRIQVQEPRPKADRSQNESPRTRGADGLSSWAHEPPEPRAGPRALPARRLTPASVPRIWFPRVGRLPLLPGPCSARRHPVAALLPRPHHEALSVPAEPRGAGGGGPGAPGPVPRSKHHQDPLGSWPGLRWDSSPGCAPAARLPT